MFFLVSVPQLQVNDEVLVSNKNDTDKEKWSTGNSDLIETILNNYSTSYQMFSRYIWVYLLK